MSRHLRKLLKLLPGIQDGGSLNPASAEDAEFQLDMLRKVQRAHEAYASALSELKRADVEFAGKVVGPAARISREELVTYMSAAVACVRVVETLYHQCPELPYFHVARTKCKSISETFEVARARFEMTAGGGQFGPETFAVYMKALTAFVYDISEVQEMVANAITKGNRNRRCC